MEQLSEDYEIEAMIVLSAGNFDIDRVVMVGAKSYTFSADGTVDIELRRLMYRIDIGKITIAPENPELLGKEIFIKNIALTNICNYFVPLKSDSIGHFYTWYLFFGNEYNMTNAFGGVERGFEFYRNAPKGWDVNGSFILEGPGILNDTFPYMINCNYQKDPGVLNVDATGILRDVTYHGYDNDAGEGLVVSSGDISSSHSMSVGKCFYGFMGRGVFNEYSIVSEYKNQNIYPKLVIELSIDGESWFYPIPVIYPQPNTVYKIDNITIKDYGSEYSNFSPIKYVVDYNISVADWYEVNINNMNDHLKLLYEKYWDSFITNVYKATMKEGKPICAYPFLIQATPHYLNAQKRIMFCGQETLGWGGEFPHPDTTSPCDLMGLYDRFVNKNNPI